MVVYRVESRTGTGPYEAFITDYEHYGDNCPSPWEDGIWKNGSQAYEMVNYSYGFTSIKQATEWFGKKWLCKIDQINFSLYKFDVPKSTVREGKKHCAFIRKDCYRKRKVKREEILLH